MNGSYPITPAAANSFIGTYAGSLIAGVYGLRHSALRQFHEFNELVKKS